MILILFHSSVIKLNLKEKDKKECKHIKQSKKHLTKYASCKYSEVH